MQTTLKEEFDGDRAENYYSITDYVSGRNKYEINCGVCNTTVYADKETSERICRSIEQGLDDSFQCIDCEEEFDKLAFEHR